MYFKYNENISIYYEKYGNDNKTLMIFPGWGNNRESFKSIIKTLKPFYTIYIFDYPGFGNSKIENEILDIYKYAQIFIAFMNKFNIKKPTVIGHSFGGRIIITMSGYYNINFNKIILMSSAGIKPKKSKKQMVKEKIYKMLKKISILLPKKIREIYTKKLISIFGSKDYKSIPPIIQKTFLNIVNEDLTKYLSNIKEEVLIIWGENDIDTPIKDAYIMNNLIKDSGLIIIKNATHFFYLERINYINKILYTYLKS